MMMSPRDRRMLIIGGTVIASLIVLSKGVPDWKAE